MWLYRSYGSRLVRLSIHVRSVSYGLNVATLLKTVTFVLLLGLLLITLIAWEAPSASCKCRATITEHSQPPLSHNSTNYAMQLSAVFLRYSPFHKHSKRSIRVPVSLTKSKVQSWLYIGCNARSLTRCYAPPSLLLSLSSQRLLCQVLPVGKSFRFIVLSGKYFSSHLQDVKSVNAVDSVQSFPAFPARKKVTSSRA